MTISISVPVALAMPVVSAFSISMRSGAVNSGAFSGMHADADDELVDERGTRAR